MVFWFFDHGIVVVVVVVDLAVNFDVEDDDDGFLFVG